ncbi:hypothetical protein ACFPU0_10080 [Pseudomonas sp. GCM10022186]|uniref:hypothetical protein n=1 Tax=Pseudomonas sp. GCM10022186 TaxID=3252650 RepID=UPI0036170486
MRVMPVLGVFLLFSAIAGMAGQSVADDKWEDEYWDGPCRVKEVSDGGDYKLEVKCPDGRGRTWRRGEWKDEYRDGPCRVKIEAKRDEYKKEVECKDD